MPGGDDSAAVEVIYRVVWEEADSGLHQHVAKSFRQWAQKQHPHLEVAEVERGSSAESGIEHTHETPVDLTRDTSTSDGVTTTTLELTQHTASGPLIVRTRAISGDSEAWVWVDAEAPSVSLASANLGSVEPEGGLLASDAGQSRWRQLHESGARSLVAELLDASERRGGQPHIGPEPLILKPRFVSDVNHVKQLLAAILSPGRPVPYLVLAWDPINPDTALEDMKRRAHIAAAQVAGLARVFVLSFTVVSPFQRLIGAELDVQLGEARLYLPGHHEAHRHRILAPEVVRSDPQQVGRWASQMLGLATAEREPPALFDRFEPQLGRQRKAPELATGADLDEHIEALESERDDLWEALYETREQRQTVRNERDELSQQLLDMEDELEHEQLRAETLRVQLIEKENQLVAMALKVGEPSTRMASDPSVRTYQSVTSVRDALSVARANLVRVEIPLEIEQHIAELDNSIHTRSFARSVFDGLLALEAYAHAGSGSGDFREWCKSSKNPRRWYASPKKLAMRESEEVMRQSELKRLRQMPVSKRVHDTGFVYMEAHLKLSNGGLAPRLYFLDDTGGSTGKVHVGYIGRHLPTKRF